MVALALWLAAGLQVLAPASARASGGSREVRPRGRPLARLPARPPARAPAAAAAPPAPDAADAAERGGSVTELARQLDRALTRRCAAYYYDVRGSGVAPALECALGATLAIYAHHVAKTWAFWVPFRVIAAALHGAGPSEGRDAAAWLLASWLAGVPGAARCAVAMVGFSRFSRAGASCSAALRGGVSRLRRGRCAAPPRRSLSSSDLRVFEAWTRARAAALWQPGRRRAWSPLRWRRRPPPDGRLQAPGTAPRCLDVCVGVACGVCAAAAAVARPRGVAALFVHVLGSRLALDSARELMRCVYVRHASFMRSASLFAEHAYDRATANARDAAAYGYRCFYDLPPPPKQSRTRRLVSALGRRFAPWRKPGRDEAARPGRKPGPQARRSLLISSAVDLTLPWLAWALGTFFFLRRHELPTGLRRAASPLLAFERRLDDVDW